MTIKLFAAAVVAMALTVVAVQFYPHWRGYLPFEAPVAGQAGAQAFVVIDVVKLINAQRALASRLLAGEAVSESVTTLTRAGEQTNAAIAGAALEAVGPGRVPVVLVKQAVVQAPGVALPDITDAVLARLGLPTDAPSVTLGLGLDATEFAQSDTYRQLETKWQDDLAADKAWRGEQSDASSTDLIP